MARCTLLLLAASSGASALHLTRSTIRSSPTPILMSASPQLPSGWKAYTDKESGDPYYYNSASGETTWILPKAAQQQQRWSQDAGDGSSFQLTPDCSWRIKIELTPPGTTTPVTITGTIRFAVDEGYEPPQGFLFVESSVPEDALSLGQQAARWTLSEDPNDKGDSLWIWGLFSEPLYPFILFELALPSPVQVGDATIPAGELYFQVDHRRKDGGVQLGEGTVSYRVTEKLAADLVGLSSVSYDEPVECGTIKFLDTVDSISKSYV